MTKFPSWIRKRLTQSDTANKIEGLISELKLHTVCQSARCPNRYDCFSKKRVTFMILGDTCTRDCRFCSVKKGEPVSVDKDEPEKISRAIESLGLTHAVITSVTRDDLEDGGAGHFSDVAYAIKDRCPEAHIEALTPDFGGKEEAVDKVSDSPIDLFGHNIETVPRLYDSVRPKADYERSLNILKRAKRKRKTTKSGIMVGLGETKDEVYGVMRDLRDAGCELLTIGQYLKPTKMQVDVYEFVRPEIFDIYKKEALSLGFKDVLSFPFARTSYPLDAIR